MGASGPGCCRCARRGAPPVPGRKPVDHRAALASTVSVLKTDITRNQLPRELVDRLAGTQIGLLAHPPNPEQNESTVELTANPAR